MTTPAPASVTSAIFGVTTVQTSDATLTYAGAPAAGNLTGSVTATGFADPFGNVVLPGVVSYNGPDAMVLTGTTLTPYTNSTGQSGTWTAGTPVTGGALAAGTATLAAGTVTVTPTPAPPAGYTVVFSYNTVGANAGILALSAQTATTFTITSSNPADTSTVNWAVL